MNSEVRAMRSATSYFKLSRPLLRENFKRFWAVPATGMLVWFFAVLLPVMSVRDKAYILRSIANANMDWPFHVIYATVFPFISTAVTLRYLFSGSAAATMHTLPFTRGRLYCTSFVSSVLMTLAPAVVSFAALMAADGSARMLAPFALTALLIVFYTALYHVAAMLTGNAVLHVVVSGFLAAALPAIVMLTAVYCEAMLYGFTSAGGYGYLALRLTPAAYILATPLKALEPGWIAAYALACAALYAAGAALYSRRPLERAGDSIVFPAFESVFALVITFAGMAAMSAVFDAMEWGAFPLNAGSVVGAALSLIAVRMVVKKSLRVFDRGLLLHGGVYAGAVAVLLAVLAFDLTGFERRVPSPERVESVRINRYFAPELVGRDILVYDDTYERPGDIVLTQPENIIQITDLHSRITRSRDRHRPGLFRDYRDESVNIGLSYDLGAGEMTRNWSVPADVLRDDGNARAIFESEEYKLQNDVTNAALGRPVLINLAAGKRAPIFNESGYVYQSELTLSSDEYDGLLDALAEDMRLESWDELCSRGLHEATVFIQYANDKGSSAYANIDISPHFTRTLAWLTGNGYYSRLTQWKDHIEGASLTYFAYDLNGVPRTDAGPQDAVNTHEFDDPELILRAIDTIVFEQMHAIGDGFWQLAVRIDTGTEYPSPELHYRLAPDSEAARILLEG
jgi:ABC-2 type transport system permease protein